MPDATAFVWSETNSPTATRTDDIWFFDERAGWLVNSNGDVRMTIDGGASWSHREAQIERGDHSSYLRCMGWSSRQVGWIGAVTDGSDGYQKALLHLTTDGGDHWSAVSNLPDRSPAGICGLCAVNEMVAYGSGSNDPSLVGPAIVKTVDGGATWQLIPMTDHADNLIDIYFQDEATGWVVGGKKHGDCPAMKPGFEGDQQYAQLKPVVLKTTDGGKNWENKVARIGDFNCGEWGWKVQFLSGNRIGFVGLENLTGAAILRTDDGGESWTRRPIVDAQTHTLNNDLEGVGFIDSQTGWVGGWGDAFQGLQNSFTSDGGRTWVRQDHIDVDPRSDRRVRINRYRFLGDPPTVAFCAGVRVYKLQIGAGAPLTTLAGGSAAEPEATKFALQASSQAGDAEIQISFTIPSAAKHVHVGIWNHFAVHVRTVLDQADPSPGPRTVGWDRKDGSGRQVEGDAYICRVTIDGRGASALIRPGRVGEIKNERRD